jgi:hypothetical protein
MKVAFRRPPPEWGQFYWIVQWDLKIGKHAISSAQLSEKAREGQKFYQAFKEITGQGVSKLSTNQSVVCFQDFETANRVYDAVLKYGGHATLHIALTVRTNQEPEQT